MVITKALTRKTFKGFQSAQENVRYKKAKNMKNIQLNRSLFLSLDEEMRIYVVFVFVCDNTEKFFVCFWNLSHLQHWLCYIV